MDDVAAIVDRVRQQVAGGISVAARTPQPRKLSWHEQRIEELRADVEGCRAAAAESITAAGRIDHWRACAAGAFLDNDIARWRDCKRIAATIEAEVSEFGDMRTWR